MRWLFYLVLVSLPPFEAAVVAVGQEGAGSQAPADAGEERPDARSPRRTVLPDDEAVVVPLGDHEGWPVVDVVIDGRGPFRMILDTGAMGVVLDADLTDELALLRTGRSRIGDPSDPTANEVDLVGIESLRLGDAHFEGLEAVSWERPPALRRPGVRGIVGLRLFAECLFTLDLPRGELRLERGALPSADGRGVLAFERDGFGAITFPIDVAGRSVPAHLDSGNPKGLVLPGSLADGVPLVPGTESRGRGLRASGPVEFTIATLDGDVRVGPVVFERPEVRFDPGLGHANVGGELLRACAVTVDLVQGRLRLAPRAPTPAPLGGPVRATAPGRRLLGIELALGAGAVEVRRVHPGSLAERAGLRAGDRLLAVDGRPVGPGSMEPLQEALGRPDAFRLRVARGADELDLTVPAAEGSGGEGSAG